MMKRTPPRRWATRLVISAFVAVQIVMAVAVNQLSNKWNWVSLCVLVPTALCWVALEVRRSDVSPAPMTVDTPGGSLTPPWGLRPGRVRGRDETITSLNALASDPDGHVHVLHGMGGCGKTTVALDVCGNARARNLRTWWIRAPDATTLATSLLALAVELDADQNRVEQARNSTQRVLDLVWTVLEQITGWVLVFDNVDAPESLTVADVRVRDGNGAIRASHTGLVMVTSRHGDPAMWGSDAVLHHIGPLDDVNGGKILVDESGPQAGDLAAAVVLSRRLGGLALGLRAAGRYLASTRAALDGVSTFAAYGEELESRFGQLFADNIADARPQEMVSATWELSLDLLSTRGLLAARPMMRLIASFASAPLPTAVLDPMLLHRHHLVGRGNSWRRLIVPMVTRLSGSARLRHTSAAGREVRDVLVGLAALGLITLTAPQPREAAASIPCLFAHPLLIDVNRHQLGDAAAQRQMRSLVARLLATACLDYHGDEPTEGQWWVLTAPHLAWIMGCAKLPPSDTTTLLPAACTAVEGLRLAGSYTAAGDLAHLASQASETALGHRHPDTLRCHNNWAEMLYVQGRWQQSEHEHRDTLALRERVLGPSHRETLRSRNNLAEVLYAQGKWKEAEAEHRNTLMARQKVLGPTHPDTLRSRTNFAWVLKDLHRYDEAESESTELLRLSQEGSGPDHPNTLTIQSDLAWIVREQGRLAEAENQVGKVIRQRTQILGPAHPDTLGARSNLAIILRDLSHLEKALAENQAVLEARTRTLGPQHPDTLTSRSNHAVILLEQGRLTEAARENAQVLAARERVLGFDHPAVLISQHNLALTQRLLMGSPTVASDRTKAKVTGY